MTLLSVLGYIAAILIGYFLLGYNWMPGKSRVSLTAISVLLVVVIGQGVVLHFTGDDAALPNHTVARSVQKVAYVVAMLAAGWVRTFLRVRVESATAASSSSR